MSSSTDTSKLRGLVAVDRSKIVDPIATNSRFLALSTANTLASFNPGNPRAVRSIAVTGFFRHLPEMSLLPILLGSIDPIGMTRHKIPPFEAFADRFAVR